MKRWIKYVYAVFAIVAIFSVFFLSSKEQKDCCLCSSLRYHAPCLVDLNTGSLLELALYVPHRSKVAELAEVQPEVSTFSFVTLGNASGIKLTGSSRIEMDIPHEPLQASALCRECSKKLPFGYNCRYVLADLYNKDAIRLFPIAFDRDYSLRCYQITTVRSPQPNNVSVTVQGTR